MLPGARPNFRVQGHVPEPFESYNQTNIERFQEVTLLILFAIYDVKAPDLGHRNPRR
jgi:hypothetical protein